MNRVCQCGGIIREVGKPFWDILPSCTCQNPVMVKQPEYKVVTTPKTIEPNTTKREEES